MKQARILTFTLVLFSLLLFIGLMPVHGEEEIYESVVRLHVLAHSDSEEDQALKLAVRDAVLAYTSPLLAECKDREEAEARLRESLDDIREVAEECLREKGDPHRVEAVLVREEYPTKSYDGICFPSGEYLSLQVKIGEAEGKNWWCCLFPSLCLGNATVSNEEAEGAFIEVGLTPPQYKIITETEKPIYRIRFKILEILRGIWD